jgi:hypothetical protein
MKDAINLAKHIQQKLNLEEEGYVVPKINRFDSTLIAAYNNADGSKKLFTIKVTELVTTMNLDSMITPNLA